MDLARSLEVANKAIGELVRKHSIACEELTEKQLVDALRQAIACGDFQRLISADGSQAVVYIPACEAERFRGRIRYLEKTINTIKEALEGDGNDYI